jgi:hypothetical protein
MRAVRRKGAPAADLGQGWLRKAEYGRVPQYLLARRLSMAAQYAEELARALTTRITVSNLGCHKGHACTRAWPCTARLALACEHSSGGTVSWEHKERMSRSGGCCAGGAGGGAGAAGHARAAGG